MLLVPHFIRMLSRHLISEDDIQIPQSTVSLSYIHIHTDMYVHMCDTDTHLHANTHVHICRDTHAYTCVHTCAQVCVYTHMYLDTYTDVYVNTHACTLAHACICV